MKQKQKPAIKSIKVKFDTWKKLMQMKLDKDHDDINETVQYLVENEGY